MKEDLTLLVLAGGMGSRFGGLKQIEPVGKNGEFIIDYSVYDALRAGFNRVVFIIKPELEEEFKKTIGKRLEGKIKVDYAFQKMDDLPEGYKVPEGREKPWGTAHAILSARNLNIDKFLLINADDFYGKDAYLKGGEFLKSVKGHDFALIGYKTGNTLTLNGSVKRGVCKEEKGQLKSIIESNVERKEGKIIATPLNGKPSFEVNDNDLVSMNMFCCKKELFPYLEEKFPHFLDNNKDKMKGEYLIPDLISEGIKDKKWNVKVVPTTAVWHGMTYKEDKEDLVESIKKLTKEGVYPEKLWK